MFVALDKLHNQGLKQAIIVVPEKSIGASFNDEPLTKFGFWADWRVEPKWNLCNAPGSDNGGKVKSVGAFLDSDDRVLVRSEEHTSELQSLMRISYAVFCLKKKTK